MSSSFHSREVFHMWPWALWSCLCVCACLCVCVCPSTSMCAHIYVHACMRVFAFVYVHVCMCIHVSVSVYFRNLSLSLPCLSTGGGFMHDSCLISDCFPFHYCGKGSLKSDSHRKQLGHWLWQCTAHDAQEQSCSGSTEQGSSVSAVFMNHMGSQSECRFWLRRSEVGLTI